MTMAALFQLGVAANRAKSSRWHAVIREQRGVLPIAAKGALAIQSREPDDYCTTRCPALCFSRSLRAKMISKKHGSSALEIRNGEWRGRVRCGSGASPHPSV